MRAGCTIGLIAIALFSPLMIGGVLSAVKENSIKVLLEVQWLDKKGDTLR
jgi:hypothetical protein